MNTTGYCGKLPQRGDFVSGKIPTTFATTWDDWAQQLVTVCNEIKVKGTGNPWFNLPVYRFYLSAGVAGDNAWIGLMLPSRDSVGREYPFCLARNVEANRSPPEVLALHQDFFQKTEHLVVQLFNDSVDFADLNELLTELDAATSVLPDAYGDANFSRQSAEPALCVRITAPADSNDDLFWENSATALLSASCSAYSIWSTSPLSNSTQETLICEAMPPASACSNLFVGDFNPQQWTLVTNQDQQSETREENIFTTNPPPQMQAIPKSTDGGDTKPLRKNADSKLPRETDILELDDDSAQPDAPWDN